MALLNFPAAQVAHVRSAVVLPAESAPLPVPQVVMAVQAALLALAWNVPEAQAVHTRSASAVGSAVEYVPAAHVAVTAAQAVLSAAAL